MRTGRVMRALALVAVLIAAGPAQAADIEAWITTAMKAAIDELVPPFERDSGHTVRVSYGPSGGIARRFVAGEPADVIVIDSGALDDLIRQGKVLPDPTAIARTGIGICVRKGAPRPDVSTPEALKRTLLAAKSIAHTAPAGGGITAAHIMKLFERLPAAPGGAPPEKIHTARARGRRHHRRPHHEAVRAARHRRGGHTQSKTRRRRTRWARQRLGVERRSRDRPAAGVRADVESRRGGDRHAAAGIAADHDLFRRRHDRRQTARRGAGFDPGAHRAVGEADLRRQRAGAAVGRLPANSPTTSRISG